jgi:hypothetical protein
MSALLVVKVEPDVGFVVEMLGDAASFVTAPDAASRLPAGSKV